MSDASKEGSLEEIAKLMKKLSHDLANASDTFLPSSFRPTEMLFSWTSKRGFVYENYKQITGNSWAIGLSRGRSLFMLVNGIKGKPLTPQELMEGVPETSLDSDDGIDDFESAKEFLVKNGYVADMVVHRQPSEELIELLLARGPVVVSFKFPPSHDNFEGAGIYAPTALETAVTSRYEKFDGHCALITGLGGKIIDGKVVSFWETLDSQGINYGVNGIVRNARGHGLITEAVEFKF